MIVTFTANPSLDRTATLDRPLTRGGVHRVDSVTVEAGGKGVNVARALKSLGEPVIAAGLAGIVDPIVAALRATGLPHAAVEISGTVRTNLTR